MKITDLGQLVATRTEEKIPVEQVLDDMYNLKGEKR